MPQMKKETFAMKIKMGEKGSFSGIAMTVGVPEGRPYFDFLKTAVAENVGKSAVLIMDHAQSQSLKTIGTVKFTSFDGKNLMFEAQLLMDAKDVEENVYPRIKAGILDGVSVGVEFEEYTERKDGKLEVEKFSIREMSVVPFPAFEKARIKKAFNKEENQLVSAFAGAGIEVSGESVSLENVYKLTQRNFESILKEIGFSNSVAEKLSIVAKGDLGDQEKPKQGELAIEDIAKAFKEYSTKK